ncbi:MAG: hypothetical protein HYR55_06035 [Acidobacteria bacterium]|nr:hypothetical protein [Acidobacteriota bacterium]MBI3656298.1 hypothetical protein [Acidobacteriota bacterium]
MQTVIGRQERRGSLNQQIAAYKSHIQNWCLQIFPDDVGLAREVAEHTVARLLDRLKDEESAKLPELVYVTTWSLGLQRLADLHRQNHHEKRKVDYGEVHVDLPWPQAIKIINGLEEKQRIAVKLRDLRGLTVEEISRVTGKSPSEAQTHINDGRRNFLIKWDKLNNLGNKGIRTNSTQQITQEIEKELRIIFPEMRSEIKDCPVEIKLLRFFDGALPRAESDALNRHTRVCGICDLLLLRISEFNREELTGAPMNESGTVRENAERTARDMEVGSNLGARVETTQTKSTSNTTGKSKRPTATSSAAGIPTPPGANPTQVTENAQVSPPADRRPPKSSQSVSAESSHPSAWDPAEEIRAAVLRASESETLRSHEPEPPLTPDIPIPRIEPRFGRDATWWTMGAIVILLLGLLVVLFLTGGIQK